MHKEGFGRIVGVLNPGPRARKRNEPTLSVEHLTGPKFREDRRRGRFLLMLRSMFVAIAATFRRGSHRGR